MYNLPLNGLTLNRSSLISSVDYGIKVSPNTVDARICRDKDLVFTSAWRYLQIDHTYKFSDFEKQGDYWVHRHAMNYIPIVFYSEQGSITNLGVNKDNIYIEKELNPETVIYVSTINIRQDIEYPYSEKIGTGLLKSGDYGLKAYKKTVGRFDRYREDPRNYTFNTNCKGLSVLAIKTEATNQNEWHPEAPFQGMTDGTALSGDSVNVPLSILRPTIHTWAVGDEIYYANGITGTIFGSQQDIWFGLIIAIANNRATIKKEQQQSGEDNLLYATKYKGEVFAIGYIEVKGTGNEIFFKPIPRYSQSGTVLKQAIVYQNGEEIKAWKITALPEPDRVNAQERRKVSLLVFRASQTANITVESDI